MSRFPERQNYERTHGAAVGAAGDGMEQGMVYNGVVQTPSTGTLSEAVAKGIIPITIPTFHLSQILEVKVPPGTPCKEKETALVIFDENKIGHVISGTWEAIPGEFITTSMIAGNSVTKEKLSAAVRAEIVPTKSIIPVNLSLSEIVTTATYPCTFIKLAASETQTLTEVEFNLEKGKAEFELKVNGVAVTFTGATKKIKVTEAIESLKLETPLVLKSKDKITLVCSSITSTPEGLLLSAFIEHV